MAVKEVNLASLVKSKMKVRAAVKGLSTQEIERVIANLTDVLRLERQKEKTKAEAVKKAKIAKIKALMEEGGLKPADISGASPGRRGKGRAKKEKNKRKAPPKYRLLVDGQEYLWSGRGRPPNVFKAYMDSGKSKESCAIK